MVANIMRHLNALVVMMVGRLQFKARLLLAYVSQFIADRPVKLRFFWELIRGKLEIILIPSFESKYE